MTTTGPIDLSQFIHQEDAPWVPFPGIEGTAMKFLVADEEENQVVFMFRFAPNTKYPKHKHLCHAFVYTISGEWQYDDDHLKAGSIAYEPEESEHSPSSGPGAELIVLLRSKDGQFLDNYMEDGSVFRMDMAFYKQFIGMSAEDAANLKIPGLTA